MLISTLALLALSAPDAAPQAAAPITSRLETVRRYASDARQGVAVGPNDVYAVSNWSLTRYDKAMQDFDKAGGYAAQSEAISMAASLGLPQEVMEQQLGTLSGGQRRRIELARILFSNADTLILDEPTNHLDADSIEWLRGYLKKYEGGFLVISHSTELLDEVVNKVWHLDAQHCIAKNHLSYCKYSFHIKFYNT